MFTVLQIKLPFDMYISLCILCILYAPAAHIFTCHSRTCKRNNSVEENVSLKTICAHIFTAQETLLVKIIFIKKHNNRK